MAASFDPALTDDVSRVRLYIGDNGDGTVQADIAGAEFQDASIQYFLSVPLSPIRAAARLAWALVAKYASLVDVTVDHQMTRASQRYAGYLALAQRLDAMAAEGMTEGATLPPTALDGPIVMGIGDCRGPLWDVRGYGGWGYYGYPGGYPPFC